MILEPSSEGRAASLKRLIEDAGVKWEVFQLPVRGNVLCISVRCRSHEMQSIVERLFDAVKTVTDVALRAELIGILQDLRTDATADGQVVFYWPGTSVAETELP